MGHRAHRGWIQRGEEKTSKCLISFYLRERKSWIIIAVGWWGPPSAEYEVLVNTRFIVGTVDFVACNRHC